MEFVQILACSSDLGNCCTDPALVITLDTFRRIFSLIQLIVPILLIISATVEFTKLVIDPDRKNGMKHVKNLFLAAVIIFVIPVIVDVVLTITPQTFSVSACWNDAKTVAETYRNSKAQYVSIYDDESKYKSIITDPGKYEPSGHGTGTGSAKGILEGAEEVHSMYEREKWTYSTIGLIYGNIKGSTYISSKKTCCATFVGSAFYVGGVFTEDEINQYGYNNQYGISDLCQNHGWTKITRYDDLEAGDIVIMKNRTSGGKPGHVQIYAGDGTWYNAGSDEAIIRDSPYSDNCRSNFLYAWRKP